ncbi:transaldolase family protein [Nonomuraea sp. 3N208]|uniref:transaldolase family protein n=1 Tax=Nonomuraea sp. 3N208 TaxID=3457421 RepID=UPI003FD43474
MKATQALHELGQSLWLDNITRGMLEAGQIRRYIDDYAVTGLTSTPSIFDAAIESGAYDDAIRAKAGAGLSGEGLFFELAVEDLQRAADAFLPIHERTDATGGYGSRCRRCWPTTPHPADPRRAGRAVRAQRVHPGDDLGH